MNIMQIIKGWGRKKSEPIPANSDNSININNNNNKNENIMTQEEIMQIAAAVAQIMGANNVNNNSVANTIAAPAQASAAPAPAQAPTVTPVAAKELNYCIYSTLNGAPYNYAFYGEALQEEAITAVFKAVIGEKAKVGKHRGNLPSVGEGVKGWRISVKNIENSRFKTLQGVMNALNGAAAITLVERESVASISDAKRELIAQKKTAEAKAADVVPEQEAEKQAVKEAIKEEEKSKVKGQKSKGEGQKSKGEDEVKGQKSKGASTSKSESTSESNVVSMGADITKWNSQKMKVTCYDASKKEAVIVEECEVQSCPTCSRLYFRNVGGKNRIYAHAGNSQLYLIGITTADIAAGAPLGEKGETWEYIGVNGLVQAIVNGVQKTVKPHMLAAYEKSGQDKVYEWLKGIAA